MTESHALNRTLTEKKLRTALRISFPKEPETEQGIIDFLNTYIDDFASRLSEQREESSLHVKTVLREDLRKELASKEDIFLTETRLQAEISGGRADTDRVETSLRAEIKQGEASLRAEISQVETSLRAEILLVKTELQAEIQEVRAEIKQVETSLRAEIKLSSVKNAFQTALIVLMILLTTPGGTHLLEKVFPFLR